VKSQARYLSRTESNDNVITLHRALHTVGEKRYSSSIIYFSVLRKKVAYRRATVQQFKYTMHKQETHHIFSTAICKQNGTTKRVQIKDANSTVR
jgi:hypothetical protein